MKKKKYEKNENENKSIKKKLKLIFFFKNGRERAAVDYGYFVMSGKSRIRQSLVSVMFSGFCHADCD